MELTYKAIGVLNCENDKSYGAPRQAVLAKKSKGVIRLKSPITKDCIIDLQDFDRVWLIYDFHHNKSWKPKVRPPRYSQIKRSVLATRSPYRPNSIGLSCVKLDKIENLQIFISEHDLLDGTPILDIKPYLSYADSFPEASLGWIQGEEQFTVEFSDIAFEKIKWLNEHLPFDVEDTVRSQLEYEPYCRKAKRVKKLSNHFVYSLQSWRLPFLIEEKRFMF